MPTNPTPIDSGFELIDSQYINTLDIQFEHYRHGATGAEHYHFGSDNDENVFLVALRTLPDDSTGVAHILEHTALCGSERYPVRDPFFMMIRRSLNTFMNAFTSSDWTAYPFASLNRKDFNNLLDVYLDAVFFSRLHELDFAQEGHRIEFTDANDPSTPLVYKGIVFNEMKGAMSSVTSTLWQTLCEHLFTDTTYHHNSGGEPADIPNLSYQQLLTFYKTHYHPSNATFMTFGNIPASEHQQKFQAQVLSRFTEKGKVFSVKDEPRLQQTKNITASYAFNEMETKSDDAISGKTHIIMAWLLGKSANLKDLFHAHLLISVLLDNSASPLQQALETTKLGTAPSPLCGLDDSNRELIFVCGIEGSDDDKTQALEQLVIDTLQSVARDGVPLQQIEAVLHQLELHQREISGDGYPYGLQIMMQTLTAATHGGNPAEMLAIEPVLAQLHEDIKDPNFIKNLAQTLLLNNSHRITLTMIPDTTLADKKDKAEADRLDKIKQALSSTDIDHIVQQSKALQQRQEQVDDDSVLPKVCLEDIPADINVIDGKCEQAGDINVNTYTAGTNGLCYQQIIIPLPSLSDDELQALPFYTQTLTELGVGKRDYLQTQAWQSEVCGSISAFSSMRGTIDDEQTISAYLIMSSKSLTRNHESMNELMLETLQHIRFDEHDRIRELVSQLRARKEQSITGNGHGLAMSAACSAMSPYAALSHKLSGLEGIKSIRQLDDSLQQQAAIAQFSDTLLTIHKKILKQPIQLLLVGEAEQQATQLHVLKNTWGQINNAKSGEVLSLPHCRSHTNQAWAANTQVNFCAKAYPSVPVNHPDSAALTVLGPFLRNGFLHRSIREQGGAYGGGASQDSSIAAFKFYSYRDPRLQETLDDFDASLQWLQQHEHTAQSLEEAILGIIGSLDKPASPAGEAKLAFQNKLFDRSPEQRRRFRQGIIAVSIADLQRVAKEYLIPEKASIAVIGSEKTIADVDKALQRYSL